MTSPSDFSPALRAALARMAEVSDRTPPAVFVGREDEIALLDAAVQGVRRGDVGHTVVVQGLPGAGKTALLHEYGARLLASDGSGGLVVPVPLGPEDLDMAPLAMVKTIDQSFLDHDAQGTWRRRINQALAKGMVVGDMVVAAMTKKTIGDFTPTSAAPESFGLALNEYAAFRFGRFGAKATTFLLLLDEAQNVPDTNRARAHLSALHRGVGGGVKVALACFGLSNTTERLRGLGLSRLASDHVRTLGALSNDEAEDTVRQTLALALADFTFDQGAFDERERSRWIGAATNAILKDSGNFPHHLANGCKALGRIVLAEGISREPPVAKLHEMCGKRRREYYDARLAPWRNHMTALAHGFGEAAGGWSSVADIVTAIMAADEYGMPVQRQTAIDALEGLREASLIEVSKGACRPVVPSMGSYFHELRADDDRDNAVATAVRAALSQSSGRVGQGAAR